MANRRETKLYLHRISQVKIWQLIVLLALSLFISATFLRLNNIGMYERREAVIAADKQGDDAITQNRLVDLQRYANSHMNASTGEVYLAEKYNRDVEKLVVEAQERNDDGSSMLVEADRICKERFFGYSQAYVQCVADEQAKFPSADEPINQIDMPSVALYRFTFLSPGWSPDFAGWSVLVSLILVLLIAARVATAALLRYLLKRNYRQS